MKMRLLLVLATMVSSTAFADSGRETWRLADYSRDYQVAARPLGEVGSPMLSESFDAGIPASWTIVDNAGSGFVWSNQIGCGGRDNLTGGSGDFACADSDAAGTGGFNTELRTPVLDLSAATVSAALTFKLNFQDYGEADTFAVDVSTNGAAGPWTNLLTRHTDSPALGEAISLNISTRVDAANVMFRFVYIAPGWDWYAQIDDVVVLNDGIFSDGFDVDVPILSESFDTGIPTSWSVVNNTGSALFWTNLAGCGEGGNYTNGTGDAACSSSDAVGPAEIDTELRAPVLDLSSYSAQAALTFNVNYQNFAQSDFFEVDVSINGAAGPWTNLLSWNEDHGAFRTTPGETVNLDISSVVGQANVMFRFHYFDPNTGDHDWYVQVDDVVVSAEVTPGE